MIKEDMLSGVKPPTQVGRHDWGFDADRTSTFVHNLESVFEYLTPTSHLTIPGFDRNDHFELRFLTVMA
jgi:hypothetical protein